jgi:hypothetical protein
MHYKYEVALSFAGEDRAFAEAVAEGLREAGVKVFYDDFYAEELWGEDLSIRLREVYHERSKFCVLIISEHYVEKMWPSFERQQAIDRLIKQKGGAYILPVRLDGFNGQVPGLSDSIGYVAVRSTEPNQVVEAFLRKIGKKATAKAKPVQEEDAIEMRVPRIRKRFTDREKNQYLKDSFEEIVDLIDQYAIGAKRQYPEFDYDMERVTSRSVIFALYQSGNEVNRFKVWLGGMLGQDAIYFGYGSSMDIGGESSYNESLSVVEDEGELRLKALGVRLYRTGGDKPMSPEEAATYLWEVVCQHFS